MRMTREREARASLREGRRERGAERGEGGERDRRRERQDARTRAQASTCTLPLCMQARVRAVWGKRSAEAKRQRGVRGVRAKEE
jgi:hypothetical protein